MQYYPFFFITVCIETLKLYYNLFLCITFILACCIIIALFIDKADFIMLLRALLLLIVTYDAMMTVPGVTNMAPKLN